MDQIPVERPPSKRKWLWIGLALSSLGLGGLIWYLTTLGTVYTNDATIEGFSVNVSPDMLGRIINLYVDEGDIVKQGDPIAQIDDDILESKRAEKIATLATMEKHVLVKTYFLDKVRNDYERATQGYEDHVISFAEFDHKQKDLYMAQADLELAKALLEQTKKELEVINTELSHLFVTAPMDGMISKRWALTGDVMRPGQAMFTMYDLSNVWVTALLEEQKVRKVRIGAPVTIHVDAYPGVDFHGKVFVIKGAAASKFSLIPQDNATGNYTKVAQRIPIKITVEPPADWNPNTPLYLFPGMNVEVFINVEHRP